MKSLKPQLLTNGVLFFIISLFTLTSLAEVLRWPQVCLSGNLEITNTTAISINGWLQKINLSLADETQFTFHPHTTLIINIDAKASSEKYSLLHFENSNSLKANFKCNSEVYPANSVEGGVHIYKKSDLDENKIWVQNLFSANNPIKIEYLNKNLKVLYTSDFILTNYENRTFKVPHELLTKSWVYLRIQALERFTAYNLTTTGSTNPLRIEIQKTSIDKTAAYFTVGLRNNSGDQFVIKITDQTMIAKAREQISNPVLEKIVFARIQKGSSGFNRNWSKKEKSLWSWSTAEITNISDIGSTACNGLPQALEDRVDSWVGNPGRICFWSYRIKKELTPSEVATGY
ncbi:MAG: hypothetical protein WA160_13375 [Pseudobdellovibrio sp.]